MKEHPDRGIYAMFGNHYIRAELGPDLEECGKADPELFRIMKMRVVQGVGNAVASKGTHRDGWCIDFSTHLLERPVVAGICKLLNLHNFAAIYREPGEAGLMAHIHCAWRDKENYAAIRSRLVREKKWPRPSSETSDKSATPSGKVKPSAKPSSKPGVKMPS